MIEPYSRLADRIRSESVDIDREVMRAAKSWDAIPGAEDPEPFIDSVALNLHGFYSGIERLFELVANQVDEAALEGESWHRLLLERMARPVPEVRPAVINPQTAAKLDEFRKFRHLVRNVYTANLDPSRMAGLMNELIPLWKQLESELSEFARFLDQLGHADEGEG